MDKILLKNSLYVLQKYNCISFNLDYKRTGSFILKGSLNNSSGSLLLILIYDKPKFNYNLKLYFKDSVISNMNFNLKSTDINDLFSFISSDVLNILNGSEFELCVLSEKNVVFLKNSLVLLSKYLDLKSDIGFNLFTTETCVRVIDKFTGNINNYSFDKNNIVKVDFLNSKTKCIFSQSFLSDNELSHYILKSSISSINWLSLDIGEYFNLKGFLKYSNESVDYNLFVKSENHFVIVTDDGYSIDFFLFDKCIVYVDNYSYLPLIIYNRKFLKKPFSDAVSLWDICLRYADNPRHVFSSFSTVDLSNLRSYLSASEFSYISKIFD